MILLQHPSVWHHKHCYNGLGSLPQLARRPGPVLPSAGTGGGGRMAGWRCVQNVIPFPGSRPGEVLTPSAARRSRSAVIATRVAGCLACFRIHKPGRSLRTTPTLHVKGGRLVWKSRFTAALRPGVRGNTNTSDTETSPLELHLSLRAIFAFVALFWPHLHDSQLPLGATDFSLQRPGPDHRNPALPHPPPSVHSSRQAAHSYLF